MDTLIFTLAGLRSSRDDENTATASPRIGAKALKAVFIMLNPSTADASNDDPTIRKCVGFAQHWNFGGLYVGNLFAVRADRSG